MGEDKAISLAALLTGWLPEHLAATRHPSDATTLALGVNGRCD